MKIEHSQFERWDRRALDATLFSDGQRDVFQDLRFRLAEAQNWHCCYCGVLMNRWRKVSTLCTIEHVIPKSAGGLICWETCVAACKKCNEISGRALWEEGWLYRLSLTLCPNCGSDNVRLIGQRAIRCSPCGRQFSTETPAGGCVFWHPPFAAMRRVAGEMIVSDAGAWEVARGVKRIFAIQFLPLAFTEAMMRLCRPSIEAARAKTDDKVEIYDAVIADLRGRYALKMPAAPERGPLGKRLIESSTPSSPFNKLNAKMTTSKISVSETSRNTRSQSRHD